MGFIFINVFNSIDLKTFICLRGVGNILPPFFFGVSNLLNVALKTLKIYFIFPCLFINLPSLFIYFSLLFLFIFPSLFINLLRQCFFFTLSFLDQGLIYFFTMGFISEFQKVKYSQKTFYLPFFGVSNLLIIALKTLKICFINLPSLFIYFPFLFIN